MSDRRQGASVRSKASAQPRGDRKNGRQSSQQSRKRASERYQNAFQLDGSVDDLGSDIEVKSEDDEEIASDEAFESGDEDRFESFKFSGSGYLKTHKRPPPAQRARADRKPQQPFEVNLNEDSDSSHENATATAGKNSKATTGNSSGSEDDSSTESQSDFEDDKGEDLMDLSEMLGDNEPVSASSSASEDNDESATDTAESSTEDAANASDEEASQSSDDEGDAEYISAQENALDNFVNQLQQKRKRDDDLTSKPVATQERKRHKVIEDNEQAPEAEYNLNLSSNQVRLNLDTMLASLGGNHEKMFRKTQTLAAPLAKPIQDRLDRGAAYDTVKEQITKWQPAVRQLREAAVLKFPLNEPAQVRPNNNSLASTFQPSNELENQISTILKDSGMQHEKSIAKFEDLEMAKLSVEEVQKRRADLAIMRDLLFRQEQKAKRQSKIKSKAYRRVHRKEKEKARLAIEESNLDPAETQHEAATKRARERMELRHKNTGKWAQKMLTRADHGEGSRAAITEQLQRGEQLESKMRGLDGTISDESDDDADAEAGLIPDEPLPDKGVFGMKFMRDADAREAKLLNRDDDDYDSQSEADDNLVENNPGRRIYKPVVSTKSNQRSIQKIADSRQNGDRLPAKNRVVEDTAAMKQAFPDAEGADAHNPWLSATRNHRRQKDTIITKDTDDGLKFAAKLKKQKTAPLHQGRISTVVLDVNKVLPLKSSAAVSDVEDEDGGRLTSARDQIALRQLDLVSQAFAGDDVVAEFEAAKDSTVAEDAPQDIDETLPGWGSWVGNGVKKSRNAKKFIKHVDGIKSEQRKDSKLQHVIINEKRMKQAKPYMSQSVPFPFETKEQYERSLSLPIGPEFTTRTNFQKQIMPHVVKKQGKVVAPMQKPFKD